MSCVYDGEEEKERKEGKNTLINFSLLYVSNDNLYNISFFTPFSRRWFSLVDFRLFFFFLYYVTLSLSGFSHHFSSITVSRFVWKTINYKSINIKETSIYKHTLRAKKRLWRDSEWRLKIEDWRLKDWSFLDLFFSKNFYIFLFLLFLRCVISFINFYLTQEKRSSTVLY